MGARRLYVAAMYMAKQVILPYMHLEACFVEFS